MCERERRERVGECLLALWAGSNEEKRGQEGGINSLVKKGTSSTREIIREKKIADNSKCFFVSSFPFYLYFCFLRGFWLLLFRFSFSSRSFACARREVPHCYIPRQLIRLSLYPSASPLVSTAAPSLTGALADFGPCPSCALPRRKERKRLELTCFMFGKKKWREGGDEKYDKVLIIIAGRSQRIVARQNCNMMRCRGT